MSKSKKYGKKERIEKADERKSVADLRTPQEQLKRLDSMFGKGLGAQKERAKLNKKIVQHREEQKKEKKKEKEEKRKEEASKQFVNKPFYFEEEKEKRNKKKNKKSKRRQKENV